MRTRFCVALLVACLGCLAVPRGFATPPDEGFANGNHLYAAGKFAEAASAYEAQVQRGAYSANLFYNLGDAYYRLGNRGRAVLNYRRALLLEPSHAEAAVNLAYIGGTPLATATHGGPAGVSVLCWLAAGAFWLAAAGVLTRLLSRRGRSLGTLLIIAGLMGGALTAGFLWQASGSTSHDARTLVMIGDAPAHYSPADNSKVVMKLPEGSEVQVLSAQGAWVYALLGDGTRAWISADKTERLIPTR